MENPADAAGGMGKFCGGGGGECVSTVSDGGGAIAAPADRLDISTASSSSGG